MSPELKSPGEVVAVVQVLWEEKNRKYPTRKGEKKGKRKKINPDLTQMMMCGLNNPLYIDQKKEIHCTGFHSII